MHKIYHRMSSSTRAINAFKSLGGPPYGIPEYVIKQLAHLYCFMTGKNPQKTLWFCYTIDAKYREKANKIMEYLLNDKNFNSIETKVLNKFPHYQRQQDERTRINDAFKVIKEQWKRLNQPVNRQEVVVNIIMHFFVIAELLINEFIAREKSST